METTCATQTPAEIDTELARIWTDTEKRKDGVHSARRTIAESRSASGRRYAEEIVARLTPEIEALRAEALPFEAEYVARGRWSRYFLVTNDGGHVHRGTNCSTCFTTTRYAWLIDLADCDEAAMVSEWGEKACTVCFPAAPTFKGYNDGTSTYARKTAAERDAASAEKAAKAADKASKAITAPDGRPLRVGSDTLRTKVAASRALSTAVQDFGWYGPTHPSNFAGRIARLVEALEAAGVETAPVIARAAKQVAKEGAEHAWPVAP